MMQIHNAIIKRAMRTVYRNGHLHHADGSLYMGRYSLFETKHLSARVHFLATPDSDHVLHDHPWDFLSVILCGGYTELRPRQQTPVWRRDGTELTYAVRRNTGSIAFRRATDRHLISEIDAGTWTLFLYGRFQNDWGHYLHTGKMHWREYLASGMATMSPNNNANLYGGVSASITRSGNDEQ